MPTLVTVESCQSQGRFVSFEGPELPGALKAGLVLSGGGLHRPGTKRFAVGFGLFVVHRLVMGGEVADFLIQGFLLSGGEVLQSLAYMIFLRKRGWGFRVIC